MRIRRCASRLLGSAYSSTPPDPAPRFELPLPLSPPPPARPCTSAPESHAGGGGFVAETASGEPCELNLSPWDLIAQLDLSDPQEEDLVVDTYFVHVACRATWLFPASMPAASIKKEVDDGSAQPPHKVAKKMAAKKTVIKKEKEKEKEKTESELKKKAKVKTEEGNGVAAGRAQIWTCKKNDGKRWFCQRPVSRPNSLCEYHSDQKRAHCNLFSESTSTASPAPVPSAASKPSTSSKPRRKKAIDAGEGFYYYAGFGPSRSKRHCRTSSMQERPPAEQEEAASPEDHAARTAGQGQADDDAAHQTVTARDDEPSCDNMTGIAGGDEESSDDDLYGCDGNGEPRVVGVNGDSKRKSPLKKRWRKPVKARSLKSLM